MEVSVSSYIIYLFHTTFEGFTKSLIHKIYAVWNLEGDVWFIVGATCVIAMGVIVPILLHKYVLSRYRLSKALFGLK